MKNLTRKVYQSSFIAIGLLISLSACDKEVEKVIGPPPSVTVVEAEVKGIKQKVTYTGRVEAVDTVELKARVEGYLLERFKEEGSAVEKGEMLFSIEKDNYQAEIDRVKGGLEKLRGAERLATIERNRRAKLVKTKAISQEQLDIAEANLIEVHGEIMSQKAALKRAELNLSYTDVKAPIGGKIGISPFSTGDFVGPSSGPLAMLVSQDPSYVSFPISQRDLLTFAQQAKKGDVNANEVVVKVLLADGSYYEHDGRLNFVDVVANPTTDTLLVRAKFANPTGTLVHQQLVNVELQEDNPRKELTVPQIAIQFDQQGRYVLLVNDENKVTVQRVEVGASIGSDIVITAGLTQGQKVITLGVQKVRPGIVVNPTVSAGG